jgi:hypothetical protein
MNDIEKAIKWFKLRINGRVAHVIYEALAIDALEKQIPKKVYHFLDSDTFETTCCGIDVTSQDYKYCPECGCSLGDVEEVEAPNDRSHRVFTQSKVNLRR